MLDEITRSHQRLTDANDQLTRVNAHLRQISDAKAKFFANITHELRTPLALILGPVEKHLRETPGMDRTLRRDLEVVQRNARTVLRHVNDLLDIAKIEAGRIAAHYTRTDVASLVQGVTRQFSALAEEQQFRFAVEVPAHLTVETDASKLHSIVLNLVANAFKFTPAGGRVRVTLRESGQRFQLEVADSGPGVPKDQRQTVFDRFERLEGEAARRPGTGLGLSIVRDFATLLGGAVTVGDAPEGGAMFALDLPVKAPAGTVVSASAHERTPPAAEDVVDAIRHSRMPSTHAAPATAVLGRVLVVEDSQDMNRFVANCLTSEGFEVDSAFDGVEGYEKATTGRPDLVVTDIVMPRMGGDELIRQLRRRPDFASTPILVLGAKSAQQLAVRLQRDAVQGYLDKPFSADERRARVRTLVARKRATAAAPAGAPAPDSGAATRMDISQAIASLPADTVQMAFQTVALEAQNLTGAACAAVAIGGDVDSPFDVWAVSGLSAEEIASAGRHAGPLGLLGLASDTDTTKFRGFGPQRLDTRSVLGVPIRCDGYAVGCVYVANKRGGAEFTGTDQRAIAALAARAGAALRAARQYTAGAQADSWLQAVIDQMPDGVQLMDQHGHATLANRALRALSKAGPLATDPYGNAQTIDFREATGDPVDPDHLPIAQAIASQQFTRRRELFIRRYDDSMAAVHVSAAPIYAPDGTFAGAAMVVREITLPRPIAHGEWSSIASPERRHSVGMIAPRSSLAGAQAADRSSRASSTTRSASRRRV